MVRNTVTRTHRGWEPAFGRELGTSLNIGGPPPRIFGPGWAGYSPKSREYRPLGETLVGELFSQKVGTLHLLGFFGSRYTIGVLTNGRPRQFRTEF